MESAIDPSPDVERLPDRDEPLQILMLEDVATDAELIRAELESEDIAFDARRVTARDGFALALEAGDLDLILVDYNLPAFDGMEALEMALEHRPTVPVVFVSGAIGEERAIETLKQGATDYVLKDKLSRLGPAVKRALREAQERRSRREAEDALRRANERLEQKVESRTT
ncbi:MAG: response regulator, partial [Bacteroidetes bacterium]|nr:response regulator [Bacteroidota bacterium]